VDAVISILIYRKGMGCGGFSGVLLTSEPADSRGQAYVIISTVSATLRSSQRSRQGRSTMLSIKLLDHYFR
jgi:hypothetical protein